MNYDDWKSTEPDDEGPTHPRKRLTDCEHDWCLGTKEPGERYCVDCLVMLAHLREETAKALRKPRAS